MNRLIVLTITVITLCNTVWAQQHSVVDSIKVQIAEQNTKIDLLNRSKRLKKSQRIELQKIQASQISNYKRLSDMHEELISKKDAKIDAISGWNLRLQRLLTSGTSVFSNPPEIDNNVPVCLRKHISLIQKIGNLADKIKSLEDKISNIENNTPHATDVEKKMIIKRVVENDLKDVDKLFNEVADLDMSTLSEAQQKFYDPGLTERYNKFLIYFE